MKRNTHVSIIHVSVLYISISLELSQTVLRRPHRALEQEEIMKCFKYVE